MATSEDLRAVSTAANPQPHLSTGREVAIELGAEVGDQILLVLQPGSSELIAFKLVDGDAPTIARLAECVGLEIDELAHQLASGIGSTSDGLAEFLQRRGDHIVASSIKAALAER